MATQFIMLTPPANNRRTLLVGILNDQEKPRRSLTSRAGYLIHGPAGTVPYRPGAWLGHPPSRSESASLSRTLNRLIDQRLVILTSGDAGTRATDVQLTPEGERIARAMREAAQ